VVGIHIYILVTFYRNVLLFIELFEVFHLFCFPVININYTETLHQNLPQQTSANKPKLNSINTSKFLDPAVKISLILTNFIYSC